MRYWQQARLIEEFTNQYDFKIAERYTLQFRGDAFNLPNHASFANPSGNLNSPCTIGKVSATSVDQRAIQFGVRVSY